MTYHVLARKWRPQTFADLVGQSHVVKALTFALSQNQVHHAYLFTGTRGVGKTSIARIFAKSLNCEANGVSANPCGVCESCREITSGKFVDLIEVDAASRTGVDETRELIESVSYRPTKGRYKVYLIDEVHMFSKSSFNALLKTLEEPPEYVKFILATTDPEKLPITILSRCLQFNLKSLTQAQIRQHLINICQVESIAYDVDALSLLANAGDGSMRDTLSLTDQAIAYGQGDLNLAAVTEILGTIHPADIEAILFAISTNNPAQLSSALHRLDDYEIDARAFLIEVMQRLQRMAWAKEGIVESLSPSLLSTVTDLPKPLIHLWYDIAEKALPNLALSGDPRKAVEMTLLRMLAFIPEDWVTRHRTTFDASLVADEVVDSDVDSQNSAGSSLINSVSADLTEQVIPAKSESLAAALVAPKSDIQSPPPETKSTPPWQEMPTTVMTEQASHAENNPNFAQQAHAKPIAEQDSLEAAEIGFMDEMVGEVTQPNDGVKNLSENGISALSPVAVSASPDSQNLNNMPLNDGLAATTECSPSLSTTEANSDLVAASAESWHLNNEASQESPPSMDDINSIMRRGNEIVAPEITAHNTVSVAVKQNDNNSNNEAVDQSETNQYEVEHQFEESLAASPIGDSDGVSTQTTVHEAVPENSTETTENKVEQLPVAAKEDVSINIEEFDWFKVVNQLPLSDYTLHFVSLGLLRLIDDSKRLQAILDLSPKHEVLRTEESITEMQTALQRYFNVPINFSVNLTDVYEKTPAEFKQQMQQRDRVSVLEQFSHDPMVETIVNELGGEVIEKTIWSINS